MPDPKGGLRPRSRRRTVLVAILVVLALAVVAVYLSGPGVRIDAWTRARVRSELSRALGRPVSIDTVHVSVTSATIDLRGVVVGAAPPSTDHVLEIPRLSATLSRAKLLRGVITIEDVRVDSPKIFLWRTADGLDGPFPLPEKEPTVRLPSPAKVSRGLILRRLQVERGTISFEDRSAPFWITAEQVSAGWEGDDAGRGQLRFDSEHLRGGSGSRSLDGHLRLQGSIDGRRASATADVAFGESFVTADGSAELGKPGGPLPAGSAAVRFKLVGGESGILPLFVELPGPVEGTLEGTGTVRFAGRVVSAEGRLHGERLRYASLEATSLDAELRASQEAIEVRSLNVRTLRGSIDATGKVEPRRGGAVRAIVRAGGISVNEALDLLGLDAPLVGEGTLGGTVALTIGDPSSLEVEANLSVRPGGIRPRAGQWAISGEGQVSIHDRVVRLLAPSVTAGATTTLVRIEKPLDRTSVTLGLETRTESLSDTAALLDGFLALQPGKPGAPWNASRLRGAGTLAGEIVFSKEALPHGHASFAFRDFAYESINTESIAGSGGADGTFWRLNEVRAEKRGGHAVLTGMWPQSGPIDRARIEGTLERWPADDVLARIGAPADTRVRVSGRMEYRGGGERGEGEADFVLTEAAALGLTFDDGRFLAAVHGSRLDMTRIALTGAQARIAARASYDWSSEAFEAHAEGTAIDAGLAPGPFRALQLTGHLGAKLDVDRTPAKTLWTFALDPEPDLAYRNRPVERFEARAEGDAESVRFTGALGEKARFSGTVALAAPHEGQGRVELEGVLIETLLTMGGSEAAGAIGGELGGEIVWAGPLDDFAKLSATATIDQVRIAVGTEALETPAPAKLSLAGGAVHLDSVELEGGGSRIKASGSIPLDGQPTLDLDLAATIDLGSMSAFVSGLAASGTLTTRLRAGGDPADPKLSGDARVEGGRLRIIGFPLAADQVQVTARIGNDGIVADEIVGAVGGGEFRGSGRVDLEGLKFAGWALEGKVNTATLRFPEGFRGVYTGTLRFEGKVGGRPVLAGDLELVRGTWQQDFGLDKVSFGGRARQPVVDVRNPEGFARTEMAIAIHAADNMWVHNDLADAEGSLSLQLGGTLGRPEITGRFDAFEGGEMRFRRVRYQLRQAAVVFPPGTRFNPDFDVVAETQMQEYAVRMHLFGNFDKLDYELTSNPPLTQPEILSLLVTGSTNPSEQIAGAPGPERAPGTPLSSTAYSVVGTEIGDLFGGKLERWLGFQEVRIDPFVLQGTTDPTTRVTVGRRATEKIWVRASVALNAPDASIYQAEYQINRKLRFLLERGELGSVGGDLRYATRFHRQSLAEAAVSPVDGAAAAKTRQIGSVVFRGDSGETEEKLVKISKLRPGGKFTRPLLVEATERLRRHYVKHDHLQAFIKASTSEASGRVAIEFTIEHGPKVHVHIDGAGKYESKIDDLLEALWLDAGFGAESVNEAEEKIQGLLRDAGYYACLVTTKIEEKPDSRLLTVTIDLGEKVKVEGVEIVGASAVSEDEIRSQVLTGVETLFRPETLKPTTLSADVEAVENLYRSRGFLQVSAKPEVALSPDGRSAWVKIRLHEGPQSRLRRVTIHGASAIDEATLRPLIRSREGEPFQPALVTADLENLRRTYDERGFPEARIAEQIVSDGDLVDLAYDITEGKRMVIRKIEIEGAQFTKNSVIQRGITVKEGDPITRASIRETQQKLGRTGLFREVQISYDDAPGAGGGQILRIKVREADNIVLGLGGGYDTENGPRASVEIADTNLWGYGRYAGFSVLYGSKLARAQATLKNPSLLGSPWSAIVGTFFERREHEGFTERGVETSVAGERKTGRVYTHQLRYTIGISETYDLSVSEQTVHEAEPKLDLGRLRLGSMGYALVRDARNDPLNATRGTYASGDIRVFAEPLGSQQTFTKLFLQGSTYIALPWRLTYVASARIGLASQMGTDQPLPLQERYFAGTDSSMRGFAQDLLGSCKLGTLVPIRNDEDITDCEDNPSNQDADGDGTKDGSIEDYYPVGGEALVVVNNELRRPIFKGLSGVVFWDSGNTFLRPGDINIGEFRNTVGVGLAYQTPVGPIRAEYGRKLDRLTAESRGEFFFTIGQTF